MRFLKIVLIIAALILIGAILYVLFFEIPKVQFSQIPIEFFIYISLALLSSVIAIIYHIKSFRFYRSKEKRKLHKKVRKIYWIGTICFSSFLLYVAGAGIISMLEYIAYGYRTKDIILLLVFAIPGFLGLLEASLTKKHIRRLRTENDVIGEIDSIGDEN